MFFAGLGSVRRVRNCDFGLENAAASDSIFKTSVTVFHYTDPHMPNFDEPDRHKQRVKIYSDTPNNCAISLYICTPLVRYLDGIRCSSTIKVKITERHKSPDSLCYLLCTLP